MKILVRGTNWIGDAVMTIPALSALRRLFPDAEITLQTHERTAGIFQGSDLVDRILPLQQGSSRLTDVLGQSRKLRAEHFDLGILLVNSFTSALTLRAGGIPKRLGYATGIRNFLLTDAVPVPEWKAERHEVYYYLNLVESIEEKFFHSNDVSKGEISLSLHISEERRDKARRSLIEYGIDAAKPVVGLGVGSSNSRAKRWPAESYADLADELESRLDAQVVLVGSNADLLVSTEVIKRSKASVVDLTGKTSIFEIMGILTEFDLLISNDMGLAHLAPAVGTKTLVIFGPTDPVTTRPFSKNADIIRKAVECSPCMLRDCPIDHRCMVNISVEEVFTKALTHIDLHG